MLPQQRRDLRIHLSGYLAPSLTRTVLDRQQIERRLVRPLLAARHVGASIRVGTGLEKNARGLDSSERDREVEGGEARVVALVDVGAALDQQSDDVTPVLVDRRRERAVAGTGELVAVAGVDVRAGVEDIAEAISGVAARWRAVQPSSV